MALRWEGSCASWGGRGEKYLKPLLLLRKIALWFSREMAAERARWILWAPVLVGGGISIYFALPFEPPFIAGVALLAGTFLGCLLVRRATAGLPPMLAALCVAAGFAAIQTDTRLFGTVLLEKPLTVQMTGILVRVDGSPEQGGVKLTIEPVTMDGLPPDRMPRRLEVTSRIRGGEDLSAGDVVGFRARLVPPPSPVAPDGFDFARQTFFAGVGGMGFAVSAPQVIRSHEKGASMGAALERLRSRITIRASTRIGGDDGAVAAAMMTGETAGISKGANDDMRISGLAHVLSISGLHMALFAGSMFWAMRMLLALIPPLALNYPIKKWSACLALGAATFYLMISVPAVATQRSYIMAALLFIAIIAGRAAISMRNIAVAALIVLLIWPDSLIGASFQMSFSAVIALVGVYESWMRRRADKSGAKEGSKVLVAVSLGGFWLFDAAITSLIAGTATGAFAAFHFNRMSSYSLIANVLATPLIGLVIMPAALVALMLMPFGLDGYVLDVMGLGVKGMLGIAHEVASWPGATVPVRSGPVPALILLSFGGLWLMLWRRRWRYLGLVPLALSLFIWTTAPRPFALIGREGEIAAVRGVDGALILTSARPVYTAQSWLRRDGDARPPAEAAESPALTCDASGCVYAERGAPTIAFPKDIDSLDEDCARSDLLLTGLKLSWRIKQRCGVGVLIDGFILMRNGATAIYDEDGSFRIVTAAEVRGKRPWTIP